MNWENRDWDNEDEIFTPKRRVNNKGSWKRPHIIGSFYSEKMQKVVEYESLNERIFYSILEMDEQVKRYYVQPAIIEIPYFDKHNEKKTWNHVPDTLVYRQGSLPHLYQIKESEDDMDTEKNKNIFKICMDYARKHSWNYSTVYPKKIPGVVVKNIDFLVGFTKKRKNYEKWIPDLFFKLKLIEKTTVRELAKSCYPKTSPLFLLPVIYHLISTGVFYTNLSQPTNEFCEVSLHSDFNLHGKLFLEQGGLYEV